MTAGPRTGPTGAEAVASAPAILVDGLVKRYAGQPVVDGASFEVRAGELVALLGPNGAGKTTTVETIEGYRRPDRGRVRVLGLEPAAGGRALRARVGLMLQDGGIDPRARARETVVQYARFHATPRDPDEVLDLVGLGRVGRTAYRRLSGGERQRLSLAIALVGRPEVLVLDEPTAGMDPEARLVTRGLVSDERSNGAAILLTSHDLTDVERIADRIIVIDRGRVVASGSPAELTALARPTVRIRLDRPLDADGWAAVRDRLGTIEGDLHLEADGDGPRYRVDGAVGDGAVRAAVAGLAAACSEAGRTIVELRTDGGSLEDAYLAIVAGARGAEP